MAGPRWSAPVFSSYSAAPPQQVQHQEPCSKPSKDASLLGGVFGIAGVSQLPAASLASKNKPRKTKGSTLRFAPERKPQKSSTGGRFCGARMEEQVSFSAAKPVVDVEAETPEAQEPQSSATTESNRKEGGVMSQARADEKRRRWADIADDDDDDTCSSHPSESTRGSASFSDYASTRGSTRGDCTDSECSEDDA